MRSDDDGCIFCVQPADGFSFFLFFHPFFSFSNSFFFLLPICFENQPTKLSHKKFRNADRFYGVRTDSSFFYRYMNKIDVSSLSSIKALTQSLISTYLRTALQSNKPTCPPFFQSNPFCAHQKGTTLFLNACAHAPSEIPSKVTREILVSPLLSMPIPTRIQVPGCHHRHGPSKILIYCNKNNNIHNLIRPKLKMKNWTNWHKDVCSTSNIYPMSDGKTFDRNWEI